MIALDTNLLVHAHRRDARFHVEASDCVRRLSEGFGAWSICYHNLVEFYGIVSHPKIWGKPSTPTQIEKQICAWTESPSLRILADSGDDIHNLIDLAKAAKVTGPMIHDARIVACCLANGIHEIWTLDRDFSRFPKLKARNPLSGFAP